MISEQINPHASFAQWLLYVPLILTFSYSVFCERSVISGFRMILTVKSDYLLK
jgi:hypothetical protein